MGVGEGSEEDVTALGNMTQLARKLYVLPGHYVVYRYVKSKTNRTPLIAQVPFYLQ